MLIAVNPNLRSAGQTSRSNRVLRFATGTMAGCLVLVLSLPAKSDSQPAWARFSTSYMSIDMTEVSVKFAGWVCDLHRHNCYWGTTFRGDMVEKNKYYQDIRIPRAYIWSAMPFSKDKRSNFHYAKDLSEPIVTGQLHIKATLPDMAPLSVTWNNWDTNKIDLGPLDVSIQRVRQSKREDIRKLSMEAIIRATAHGVDAREVMRKIAEIRKRANPVDSYLGYELFNSGGSAYYYISENDRGETSIIQCWDRPQKASKTKYCTHSFRLNDKLIAELSFIDFRANGGIDFMRRRIRAFKEKFCPIFNCDLQARNAPEL